MPVSFENGCRSEKTAHGWETHHSRKGGQQIDADVEVFQAIPEEREMGRQLPQQVVPQREFLDLVPKLLDHLDRDFGDPLVAQIDRVELSEGVRAGGRRESSVARRRRLLCGRRRGIGSGRSRRLGRTTPLVTRRLGLEDLLHAGRQSLRLRL